MSVDRYDIVERILISMEQGEFLEIFEKIKEDFLGLSLEEFTAKHETHEGLFDLWSVISDTPLRKYHRIINKERANVLKIGLPMNVRRKNYTLLQNTIDEIIEVIKTGRTEFEVARIPDDVINKVSDEKIKKLCFEINSTPDANTISLLQNLGETLKWTLHFKAKQLNKVPRNWSGELGPILNSSINDNFYTGIAVNRFLREFRDNFIKNFYDMLRHDEKFVPTIPNISNSIKALSSVVDETFEIIAN